MEVGLLLIQVVTGVLIAGHGAQKLFGAFGGPGVEGFTGFTSSLGLRPARPLAVAAGVSELIGGGLLVLGLAIPLAAALIVSTMVVAARTAHAGKGVWVSKGGWELPLLYAAVPVGVAVHGAGPWSLDAAIGWDVAGLAWGLGALGAAVVGAAGVLALTHRKGTPEIRNEPAPSGA